MIREVGNENNMMNSERVFDTSIELADNAMLKHRMELYDQWDFEKNDEIGLDIYKATKGSEKVVWWNCPKCESPYDMMIESRAGKKKSNCPYCSGYRINNTNSLAALSPKLASEWHPTLNGKLTPYNVTMHKNKKVWWLGAECGHHWDASIDKRAVGGKCPYCAPSPKLLLGFNDMWTTNPEQAKLLADPEDGYRYTQASNVRVDWKCLECENAIKGKMINTVYMRGITCPRCSDGLPFGEKFVYNLLKEASIDFEFDEEQEWSDGRRYDFYITLKDVSYIIEVHGIQHYEESRRGRPLKEEQENDRLKEQLAKENGVSYYITIDARESTVEWMKANLLNSGIMKIVGDADFEKIGRLSSKSLVKTACDLWNSGVQSVPEIVEIVKLSRNTVVSYLKKGAEIGWCDYCPKEAMRQSATIAGKSRVKTVVQLDKNLCFIKHWESARDVDRHTSISFQSISLVCTGKNKTAGGFKWMFKEDYDKLILNQKGIS